MIILKWPLIGCSAILSSIVFQLPDQETNYNNEMLANTSFAIAPATEGISIFKKKKKKQKKPSSKMKRHNKSMGKKFRRQNDDALRR